MPNEYKDKKETNIERTGDLEIEFVAIVDNQEVDVDATYEQVTLKQAQMIIETHETVKRFTWR